MRYYLYLVALDKVKARDGNFCYLCGRSGVHLFIHHIMHPVEELGFDTESLSNKLGLCERCKFTIHDDHGSWRSSGTIS